MHDLIFVPWGFPSFANYSDGFARSRVISAANGGTECWQVAAGAAQQIAEVLSSLAAIEASAASTRAIFSSIPHAFAHHLAPARSCDFYYLVIVHWPNAKIALADSTAVDSYRHYWIVVAVSKHVERSRSPEGHHSLRSGSRGPCRFRAGGSASSSRGGVMMSL